MTYKFKPQINIDVGPRVYYFQGIIPLTEERFGDGYNWTINLKSQLGQKERDFFSLSCFCHFPVSIRVPIKKMSCPLSCFWTPCLNECLSFPNYLLNNLLFNIRGEMLHFKYLIIITVRLFAASPKLGLQELTQTALCKIPFLSECII